MRDDAGVKGVITSINGSVIKVEGFHNQAVGDMVEVSLDLHLTGEIIKIIDNVSIIQCYEETAGLNLNAIVTNHCYPLSMELGPGMLNSIFDGIQRPLTSIADMTGDFIDRGMSVDALNRKTMWDFNPTINEGSQVKAGDIIGYVHEFSLEHKIMVPPNISGVIQEIKPGKFTLTDVIYKIKDSRGELHEFSLLTKWPIRSPRPVKKRKIPQRPLLTGTRVFDLLFPVARGGVVAVPGGFGTGKTVVQHSLAKFADADVIVYIGCGERGNEMADLLNTFPFLEDPVNNRPLMERTIMIANTSNMPVSAREASIFSGITMAEYWRDMGNHVLLLADSTSRWAEALRELSGRLEELPIEGGYPAYLATRLSNFYERAGLVEVLGSPSRMGSITIVGAVSPPGGDFSEPVTTNTKRFVKAFWALDARLAYARHYPSVNWVNSYSLYDNLATFWESNIATGWQESRKVVSIILSKAEELNNIAKLIGPENLPPDQQLVLFMASLIKDGFLIQNGFNENDRFSSPEKTMKLISVILEFYDRSLKKIRKGVPFFRIREMHCLQSLRRARLDIGPKDLYKFEEIFQEITHDFEGLKAQYEELL
ncbi:V-type ATP synthase subunit A [Candidatus Lokiarchaeum ossiferum]|uniref:V-type ATP synthase subunit A n=1 Tax=Candidatus Lokiarchaeum ossiferum TaxID=2951803 RepID=UPI00352F9A68